MDGEGKKNRLKFKAATMLRWKSLQFKLSYHAWMVIRNPLRIKKGDVAWFEFNSYPVVSLEFDCFLIALAIKGGENYKFSTSTIATQFTAWVFRNSTVDIF